jgi:ATP-grasp domain
VPDREALRALMLRFSLLLRELPEVVETDLNPVRCMTNGCVVLDMRLRIEHHSRARQDLVTGRGRQQRRQPRRVERHAHKPQACVRARADDARYRTRLGSARLGTFFS